MGRLIPLECRCGKMKGSARDVTPESGNHVVCLCDDCQAYLHSLGRADLLDENGGSDIYQLTPSQVIIHEGIGNLQCLRLTEKGLTRWYASCCSTPVGNTLGTPKVPFIGMLVAVMKAGPDKDEGIGPVLARIQGKFGKGQLRPGTHHRAPLGLILRSLKLFAGWKLKGKGSPHPFFDANGNAIRVPRVLSSMEREKLRHLS